MTGTNDRQAKPATASTDRAGGHFTNGDPGSGRHGRHGRYTSHAGQDRQLRLAAGALAAAGLVHAYGHCSLRLDSTSFLVTAPIPLGRITDEPGTIVPLDGPPDRPLPDGVLGEVRIHREIYRHRADVGAVCRIMPPAVMALSAAGIVPVPRHGVGAYFAELPLWDDPRLLRNDAAAARIAERLGDRCAIVMRGNGAVVVGEDLPQAVTLGWFLEDAARVERDLRAMGLAGGLADSARLDAAETADRQVWSGGVAARMWHHLTGETI